VQKPLPKWALGVLSVAGVALVASMLLCWIDTGDYSVRGLGLAWRENHWLFLVPLAGAALVAASAAGSPHTRLAALFAGIVVTGYTLFSVAHSILHSGLDTWLVLGGAGVMLAGMRGERTSWRAVGGIAVLAGFFAPWVDWPMWRVLTMSIWDNGVANVLWLIPVGGVLGIAAAGNRAGAQLALVGAALVYGSIVLTIGVVATAVFGLGMWVALAASTTALVIGALARQPE
jgi:FtsH-binding integral membrane protein